jgi:hypothetical protein
MIKIEYVKVKTKYEGKTKITRHCILKKKNKNKKKRNVDKEKKNCKHE